MKQLSSEQEKLLIELENIWLKFKRLRNKSNNQENQDFLSMKEREEIIDKIFNVIFND